MKIVIGSDDVAEGLKKKIINYLEDKKVEILDIDYLIDENDLYPDVAFKVCNMVKKYDNSKGILLCGTGIGMSISANKVKGIRAAVTHDILSLERSVLSNNCHIVCFGSRIIAFEHVKVLLDRWLELKHEEGPSSKKINRICELELYDQK